MEPYVFMWCRIFLEGSSLNIEIRKEFKRPRVFRSKRALQGDLLCQASIEFDDLWNHLASEAHREINCELIFASIISHLLRDLSELTSGIHEPNFRVTVLDCRWGMRFITVDVDSLLKLHRRPAAIYALWTPKSRKQQKGWNPSNHFWAPLILRTLVLGCLSSSGWPSLRWRIIA